MFFFNNRKHCVNNFINHVSFQNVQIFNQKKQNVTIKQFSFLIFNNLNFVDVFFEIFFKID